MIELLSSEPRRGGRSFPKAERKVKAQISVEVYRRPDIESFDKYRKRK
jgi:hypothetical protein